MRAIDRSMWLTLALVSAVASGAAAQQAKTATPERAASAQQRSTRRRAKRETQAQLKAEAKVTEEAARATALAQVPGGKVQESELEREAGKLVYSFDIKVEGKSGVEEVLVDAVTGQVVKREHESAKKERAEARKERREMKKEAKETKKEEAKETKETKKP